MLSDIPAPTITGTPTPPTHPPQTTEIYLTWGHAVHIKTHHQSPYLKTAHNRNTDPISMAQLCKFDDA